MTDFDALLERVKALTGLTGRAAAAVAFELPDNPKAHEIVAKAKELGHDVETPAGANEPLEATPATAEEKLHAVVTNAMQAIGCSMSPPEVLGEVYMTCPRVLTVRTPKMGRAPDQAYEHFEAELAEMPEDVKAMLVKIDVFEGKATFWLRDEANNIDRPLGPIDLTLYESEHALSQALAALMSRLDRVLAADSN